MTPVESDNNPRYELADIYDLYWEGYKRTHKISPYIHKIIEGIRQCRTSLLGYHKTICSNPDCAHEEISYNSCRNRHCPKCQGSKQIEWVNNRLKELLPVPYFHSVFTMPHTMNNLSLYNQALIYDLFFHATSYALNRFSQDEKYLGGQLGFFGILHTWGQNLTYHVHIHYIISGCGLLKDCQKVKRLPYQEKFLFPVEALSKTVRSYFIKGLKESYYNGELRLPGELARFSDIDFFERFCHSLGTEAWYCYTKPPFSSAEKVVEYIGRYTHRVALSNGRIQAIHNNQVTFSYKDYKDGSKIKTMSLPSNTFIQRMLYHILPYGFRKIRHYGFLSGSQRAINFEILRALFDNIKTDTIQDIQDWLERFKGCLERICPVCQVGTLLFEFSYDSS